MFLINLFLARKLIDQGKSLKVQCTVSTKTLVETTDQSLEKPFFKGPPTEVYTCVSQV